MKHKYQLPAKAAVAGAAAALLLATFGLQRLSAQTVGPSTLQEAWAKTERAGRYQFETRLTQTTFPAARITAVGQKARTQTLIAKGTGDRSKGLLELALWDDPSTALQPEHAIEVRIEGARAFGRTSRNADWQPMSNVSAGFAPAGDAAAFLSAAENVSFLGRDQREVPTAAGTPARIAFDRYRFTLNGDQYAELLRRQLEDQLERSGDLPAGIKVSSSDHFRRMVGTGEAWIDAAGMPLRLTLDMEHPLQANGERVRVKVDTTFLGFEKPPAAGIGGALRRVADQWSAAVDSLNAQQAGLKGAAVLAGMLLALGLIFARPRRAEKPLVVLLSAQIVLAPLATTYNPQQLQRFRERYPELAQAAPATDAAPDGPRDDEQAPFDTTRPPLPAGPRSEAADAPAASPTRPPVQGAPEADPQPRPAPQPRPLGALAPLADGPDTDEDGLEDSLEATWTTNPGVTDTDGDGISDGSEVDLCPDRSAYNAGNNLNDPACSDPYYSDTDLDGLTDAEEVLYLGTLAQQKDTDLDGITDAAEVKGFLLPNGVTRRWSDPNNPDTDGDGLLDGVECPAMRRTSITADYQGSASGNSPWTNVIQCNDTDADGTPDIFDADSDADGVPDAVDRAPTRAFGVGAPFNRSQPMNLRVDGLSQNRPVMVDFQIRPVVPEHLSYAMNVLDWPTGDTEGQIQRARDTTFGDADGGDDRSFNGDMRLTPMLEVTLPGNTLDLPRTSPSSTVQLLSGGRVMGTVALQPTGAPITSPSYGISITAVTIATALPGALSIGQGTCQSSTPKWSGVAVFDGQAFFQAVKLGDYANGAHVLSLVLSGNTYCTPIPKLVDGTRTLTILLQEQVQPFGTLTMTQSGGPAFRFGFSAPGTYSATVSTGDCSAPGALAFTLPSVTPATSIPIPAANLVDVVDGAHALRLKRSGETILCAPLGNIVNGSLTTMIDAAKLTSFQISVSENADGTLSAFVPLGPAVEAQTGKTEAFHGRMFYQHNTAAPISHTVNLVWLVTVMTDFCPEANCSNPGTVLDQSRVVHQYRDESWVLTGLGVSEEQGVDVAVVYEDPAAETDTAADRDAHLIEWNDNLWHLANGLSRIFVEGVDCDAGVTTTCAGVTDNQRDLKVADIKTRWDSAVPGTATARWDIPADALNVVTATFAHPGEMGVLSESTLPALLTQQFGTGVYSITSMLGTSTTVVYPTLLVATEQRSRAVGASSTDNVTVAGRTVAVNFDPGPVGSKVEPVTSATLSWKPFRRGASAWEPMPLPDYWDYLGKMLPLAAAYTSSGDRESEYEAAADIRMTQVAYVNLYAGIGKAVEAVNANTTYLLSKIEEGAPATDKEFETTSSIIKASGETTGGFSKAFLEPVFDVLDREYALFKRAKQPGSRRMAMQLDYTLKGSIGRGVRDAIGKFTGYDRLFDSGKNATLKGRAGGVGGVLTSSAAQLMVGLAKSLASIDSNNNTSQQIAVNVLQGVASAQAVGDGIKILHSFSKFKAVVGETNLGALSKVGEALQTSSKAAKVAAVVGLVLELGISFGIFVYQITSAGVIAFSLQFNAALSQWAAGAIVALLLAALATTGVGALVVAVIGLIDSLISLFCGIFHPEEDENIAANWTCKGLSGILQEGVAYFIYDSTDIIDIDNPDRLRFKNVNPYLADPQAGFVTGAAVRMDLTLENTIRTEEFDSPLSLLYGWQFNESNTREATFAYAVVGAEEEDASQQIHNSVKLGDAPGAWIALGDGQYRQTVALTQTQDPIALPAAGINQTLEAYLAEGYASPTQECITVPNIIPPWFPPVIPVCYVRSRNASNYLNLGLVYDVFPATLSGFYTLEPKYGGYALAWGQTGKTRFPMLNDADGDGLNYAVDPNDSLFDTDGDGLTDLREVQIGTSPTQADTDGDGLSDRDEARYGSDPLASDTDGDGLTDAEEKTGWSIGYNYIGGVAGLSWAYSDPRVADADDDDLFDKREQALGTSPLAASDPSIVRYSANLKETDAVKLLMRFDEGADARKFVDSSGPDNPAMGHCADPACPVSGLTGLAVNAVHFDGDDVVSLGMVPRINALKRGFSIAAWVKLDTLSGRRRIISIARTHAVGGFSFGVDNGRLLFTAYGLYDYIGSNLSDVPLGTWTHVGVAIVPNGANTEAWFFIDGVLKETVSHPITGMAASPTDDVLIGGGTVVASTALNEPWIGYIDELAVFDRPLSAGEMTNALYNMFNLDDAILTAEAPVRYETELESRLLARNIEGVLQSSGPAFLSGLSTPRNIMLSPRQVLPTSVQTLTFNTAPASGAYAITQTLGAIVDVPYKPETSQDANLVYRSPSPLRFNGGVFDRREVASNANYNLNATDFTMAMWLSPDPFIPYATRGVAGYRSGESNGYPSIQQIGTTLRFGYGTVSGWQQRDLTNAVPADGKWHHVAVSFVRNNGSGNAVATVYVDTVNVGALNFGASLPSSIYQRFDIGRSSQTARFTYKKFDLACEADGAGNGEYTINYWTPSNDAHSLVWSGAGTDGASFAINVTKEFEDVAYVSVCENDPDGSDQTTCDGDDELMVGSDYLPWVQMSTADPSYGTDVSRRFSTTPTDPTCGFWTGYDDTATITYTFANNSIPYIGDINDFRLYRRALSASDVTNLYQGSTVLARFKLDERPSATLFADDVARASGVCSGSSCPVTGLPGRDNVAARFDGINDYVTADQVSALAATAAVSALGFSFGAWIKPDLDFDVSDSEQYVLSFNGNNYDNRLLLGVVADGPGHFKVRLFDGSQQITSPANYPRGQWLHISALLNYVFPGEDKIVINGSVTNVFTTTSKPAADGRFSIGQEWDPGGVASDFFRGMVDLVSISQDPANPAYFDYFAVPISLWHMDALSEITGNFGAREVAGQVYGGFDLGGASEFISLPPVERAIPQGSSFTIMGWVYPRKTTGNGSPTYRPILGSHLDLSPWMGLVDGKPALYNRLGDSVMASRALPPEQWSHLAFQREAGQLRLYVNGSVVASRTQTSTLNALIFNFGRAANPGSTTLSYFDGVLDEFSFHSQIVPADTIRAAYNYQATWIDEARRTPFVVDVSPPTARLAQEGQWLPLDTHSLLFETADANAPVVSALYLYADSQNLDQGFQFPPKCRDAVGGVAFCGLFTPEVEGRYGFEVYSMDAAGNVANSTADKYLFVDGTAPSLTLSPLPATPFRASAAADQPARWTIPMSGTVADPLLADGYPSSGVASVRVRLFDANGAAVGAPAEQIATVNAGTWTLDYVISADNPSGVYSGTILARDGVENLATGAIPPFRVDNTDPASQITGVTAPPAAMAAARALAAESMPVVQYLNANSLLAGDATEKPDSAGTQQAVAGVQAVDVGFEPILGPAFVNAPLPGGMALYLPFDENNVTQGVSDTSFLDLAYGYTVTCAANGCPVAAIAARSGQGVYFDGVDDRLSRAVTPGVTNLTSTFAVGAWIKLDRVQGEQHIVGTDRAASSNDGWAFGTFDDKLRFVKFGSSTYDTFGAVLKPDVWYHVVAFVRPDNDVDFYVNGNLVSAVNTPQPGIANTNDPLIIGGAAASNPRPLAGVIDELFVYKGYFPPSFAPQLMGGGPTVHLTFDEAPIGPADNFKEAGGMDVVAGSFVGGGSADRSTIGIAGPYGLEFGSDKAYAISALAGPGVLPTNGPAWTLSFWLRDAGSAVVYLTYTPADTLTAYAAVFSAQDDTVTVLVDNAGTTLPLNATDGWNHYAFTWDGSRNRVYQNGALMGAITPTGPILLGPTTWLVMYDTDHPKPTAVDDVMVFNRTLPAEELGALAAASWRPAAMTSGGAGVPTANWSSTIPAGLEGFYAVKTRGRDVAGNVNVEPVAAWSGLVDTLGPRIVVVTETSGGWTTYYVDAIDFSLDPNAMRFPAACGSPSYSAGINYGSPWYLGLRNQDARLSGSRLYRQPMACSVEGALPANATFGACDVLGNCSVVNASGNPLPTTRRIFLPNTRRTGAGNW